MKWPPRVKDQKAGRFQIGLFVRGPDGDVAEVQIHDFKSEEYAEAQPFLALMLNAWVERMKQKRESGRYCFVCGGPDEGRGGPGGSDGGDLGTGAGGRTVHLRCAAHLQGDGKESGE